MIVVQSLHTAVQTTSVGPVFSILGFLTEPSLHLIRLVAVEGVHLDEHPGLVAVEIECAVGRKAKALEEGCLIDQFQVVVEGLVVHLVITGRLAVQESDGVHHFLHGRIVGRVILGGNADHRIGGIDIVEKVPVHVEGTGVQVGRLTESRRVPGRQVLGKPDAHVGVETVTIVAVVAGFEDGIVIGEVSADVVVHGLVAAGERDVVLLVHGHLLVNGVVPVGVDVVGVTALIGGDHVIGETV